MDPYSSPYITPNNSPHDAIPHSLLRTRQLVLGRKSWSLASSAAVIDVETEAPWSQLLV